MQPPTETFSVVDSSVVDSFRLSLSGKLSIRRIGYLLTLLIFLILVIALIIVSQRNTDRDPINQSPHAMKPSQDCKPPVHDLAVRMIKSSINYSADPCANFYDYACGMWNAEHPLSADESSIDQSSIQTKMVDEKMMKVLDRLLNKTQSKLPDSFRKAVSLYRACLDVEPRERLKGKPLLEVINDSPWSWPGLKSRRRGKQQSKVSVEESIAYLQRNYNIKSYLPLSRGTRADYPYFPRVLEISAPETVLTNLDYYFDGSVQSVTEFLANELIVQYKSLIEEVAVLLKRDSHSNEGNGTDTWVKLVCAYEYEIAARRARQLDRSENVFEWTGQAFTISDLENAFPSFGWRKYLKLVLPKDTYHEFFIQQHDTPSYILIQDLSVFNETVQLLKIIGSTSKEYFENYMVWRLIYDQLPYLSIEYRSLWNEFMNETMGETKPSCIQYLNDNMIRVMERIYVDNVAEKEKFEYVYKLALSIREATGDLISSSTWMDDNTKLNATNKLDKMESLLGILLDERMSDLNIYYSELLIEERSTFFLLQSGIRAWKATIQFDPITETRYMTSLSVNAQYLREWNEINVPYAIQQEPAFHVDYPAVLNYGGLGFTIGHEISHGYDKGGSKYNAEGEEVPIWSSDTKKSYTKIYNCFIDQFNQFCPLEDTPCISGEKTLDDNIADTGGMKAVYTAYKTYRKYNQYRMKPLVQGLENFTDYQILFLSFANQFCTNSNPWTMQYMIYNDEHAPNKYRIIGTLQNMQEFADAFNCPRGSYMNPNQEKCNIWE